MGERDGRRDAESDALGVCDDVREWVRESVTVGDVPPETVWRRERDGVCERLRVKSEPVCESDGERVADGSREWDHVRLREPVGDCVRVTLELADCVAVGARLMVWDSVRDDHRE